MSTLPPPPPSALRAVPLAAWARRFCAGTAELRGRLCEPVEAGGVRVDVGTVWVHVEFTGGPTPTVDRARVSGRVVDLARDRVGAELEAVGDTWRVDGFEVAAAETESSLGAFLDRLHDVELAATAWPDGELLVGFASGVRIVVPDGRAVVITGAADGAPHDLRLSRPLKVAVEGEGVQVSMGRSGWLSSMARVRISEAHLHPDGSVALEGRSGRFDRAVRTGLKSASAALSQLVRRSPRFAHVRSFLR